MSEIYRRSMGMTYDERRLELEIGSGVTGYSVERPEPTYRESSGVEIDWESADAELNALLAKEAMLAAEERMEEIAIEHPKYTWHVGQLLAARLDQMALDGRPVDEGMFLEAADLAQEIVLANPDKNAEELRDVVEAMIVMIQAESRMRRYTLAA